MALLAGSAFFLMFRHYLVPGIIALFSCAVIVAAMQLDLSPPMIVGESMQPRAFPIFLMVLNLILVALLVMQIRRSPPDKIPLESFPTWGSMILMVLFYFLTTYLDMFIGIAVVMFFMCFLWGERRWWVALVTALATPILIFILFDSVLKIRFPRGILINWYYG